LLFLISTLNSTANCLRGLAEVRHRAAASAGTASHRPPGPSQPGPSSESSRPSRPISGPGTLGREPGLVRGNLSLRPQAVAVGSARTEAAPGLDLGQDPGRRYFMSKRPRPRRQSQVLHQRLAGQLVF
jgi:hypothetical protein